MKKSRVESPYMDSLHSKTMHSNPRIRSEAVNFLRSNFAALPDKEQAWDDLIHLACDDDMKVWLATAG